MRRVLIIIWFGLISLQAMAQQGQSGVKVDVPDSTALKQAAKRALEDSLGRKLPPLDTAGLINKAKNTAKTAAKDTLDNYIDIPDVKLDSTLSDQVKGKVKQRVQEEIGYTIPADSAAVKKEATQLAKDQLKAQTGIDAPDITLDSTTADQVKEEAKTRAENALKNTDEFKALEGTDSPLDELKETEAKIKEQQEQLKQQAARKELKQKMTSRAKEFITEHADKIQEVQSQMGELKKKYSVVPNSNDLSTARKRSSLEGESFWDRLIIGGNFNISETNPVSLDISPLIGWKFNKLFEAGVTGTYRARFGTNKALPGNALDDEKVYGYSVFANHMAFKSFFGYLEAERISKVTGTVEDNSRRWNQTLLLGIGRKFNVAKFLEMQAIISYNFLHDNADGLYNSPVVFKTGVRINK